MNGQIFISYRRDDTSYPAGRLYDRLSVHFPSNQIFIDVDSIDPGEDFVKMIKKTVGSCDVLIAVIGKGWLASCDQEGQRRLDNPEDFVRIEIGTALERDVRVEPLAPKPAEPEREKPPPLSSGGTGGKSPSKQVSPQPLPPPPPPPLSRVEDQSQIIAHFFFRQRSHATAGSVSVWLDGSLVRKTPLNLGINAAAPCTIGEHIVEVKLKCLGLCFNEKFYFKLLDNGEYRIDLDQNPVTSRLTCEVQKITPKN